MSRIPNPIKLPLKPVRFLVGTDPEMRNLEDQRDARIRHRRHKLLLLGLAISVIVHLTIMLVLSSIHRWRPAGSPGDPVEYEFAILQEEQLTQLEQTVFDDLSTEAIEDETMPEESAELSPEIPAVAMEFAAAGAVPALGGAGAGEDFGLSGGAAGTSFFGVSSSGTRFAFIVDRSGSMGDGTKMLVAKRELARSIQGLPDYAEFFVVMFSSDLQIPNFQDDWLRAKKTMVARMIRWLNSEVDPIGGTKPRSAFQLVFSLEQRPDVIYFLTDGEITGFDADEVAALNRRGKRVVINTIAFGDPSSQDLLKDIAAQSGGVYRFVPASTN